MKHDVDLKAHLTKLHQTSAGKPAKEEGHLCYWEITKVRLKDGGNHGKAWGRFVWRGKYIDPKNYVDDVVKGKQLTRNFLFPFADDNR